MLDKIKNTCQYVVFNSRYVKINYNKLNNFINNIDSSNLKNWILYNPYNILELDIETIINFLLIFEAIDYSFWGQPKWEVNTDDGIKDGSDALLYIMLKYVKETKTTDFSNITNKLDNAKSIDINDFLFMYSKKVKDIVKPYHLCRNTNY